MTDENKRKVKVTLPALCEAVKNIRLAHGDSQERFAQRVGLSTMTISRFELGKQVPRDLLVLRKLFNVTADRAPELTQEIGVIVDALHEAERVNSPYLNAAPSGPSAYSLQHWRLMSAVKIAFLYYPERVAAIEKAAGPAIALVDDVLKMAKGADYAALDRELNAFAEHRALAEFQREEEKNK